MEIGEKTKEIKIVAECHNQLVKGKKIGEVCNGSMIYKDKYIDETTGTKYKKYHCEHCDSVLKISINWSIKD